MEGTALCELECYAYETYEVCLLQGSFWWGSSFVSAEIDAWGEEEISLLEFFSFLSHFQRPSSALLGTEGGQTSFHPASHVRQVCYNWMCHTLSFPSKDMWDNSGLGQAGEWAQLPLLCLWHAVPVCSPKGAHSCSLTFWPPAQGVLRATLHPCVNPLIRGSQSALQKFAY